MSAEVRVFVVLELLVSDHKKGLGDHTVKLRNEAVKPRGVLYF